MSERDQRGWDRKRRDLEQGRRERVLPPAPPERPYSQGRGLAGILRIACALLGTLATAASVFFHLWMLTATAGDSGFLIIVTGLLYSAGIAFLFALAYLVILGIEALFDQAEMTELMLDRD